MSEKVLYAVYDDGHDLKIGAERLVEKGVHVHEVYSPFPIHGIEKVIGVPRTRLAIASFIFGVTGVALALIGMKYFMVIDWPQNIGGKPSFSLWQNLPAFVPITFEFGVLCAAHGMAITYFIRNGIFPGVEAKNPDPRSTDDKFVMEIRESGNSKVSFDEMKPILQETGATELNERIME